MFHAKLAREQRREGFAASPFGGLRGLPLPYSLFLLSYYLFFPRHEGTKYKKRVSHKARKGAKIIFSRMFHRNILSLARDDNYVVSFLRNVW